MKINITAEILAMKPKDKKTYNMNLVVTSLELIMTKMTLLLLKIPMKYLGTSNTPLLNRLNNHQKNL